MRVEIELDYSNTPDGERYMYNDNVTAYIRLAADTSAVITMPTRVRPRIDPQAELLPRTRR